MLALTDKLKKRLNNYALLFKTFFDVDFFFKVFIEFVTVLLLFYVWVFWPGGLCDLISSTRD